MNEKKLRVRAGVLAYIRPAIKSKFKLFMKRNGMTIEEATSLYLLRQEGMISANTMRIYRHSVEKLIACFSPEFPVRQIGKTEAEEFRSYLLDFKRYSQSDQTHRIDGKGLAISTVIRTIKNVRIIFAWLVECGEIESNPFFKIKLPAEPPKKPDPISPNDFVKLIKEARQGVFGRAFDQHYIIRDTAMLFFYASTGCRTCGIANTHICDLQFFENGGVTVVHEKHRGGRKARVVPLTESAAYAIMEWLEVRPETRGHDFLFTGINTSQRGRPLKENAFAKVFERLKKRYNDRAYAESLEPINSSATPHKVRKTCATQWVVNGMSEERAAKTLGHSVEIFRKHYQLDYNAEILKAGANASWLERIIDDLD